MTDWTPSNRRRDPNIVFYNAWLKDMGGCEYIGPVLAEDLNQIEEFFEYEIVGTSLIIK